MSEFDLIPVEGGDPIRLPAGETVLGRGPLLGISDKRVSRHHGLLENLNGQLCLKPTHLNPCFVQSSPTDNPRPLQKGSWYPLHDGDLFSLLPGHFIYKVVAVGGDDHTPRNSRVFEEELLPVCPQPDVESSPPIGQDGAQTLPQEEHPPAVLSHQEKADSPDRCLNERDSAQPAEVEDERSDVPPSEPRRRVLPAWMMAAVAPPSSSSSPKVQSAVTGRKGAAAKPAKISSSEEEEEEEEELSKEEMPKKRRRKMLDDEDVAQSKMDVPLEQLPSESNSSQVSDESDGITVEVDEEGRGGETSTKRQPESEDKTSKKGQDESVASDSGSSAPPKPGVRAACPYGKDCYRKNLVHFQECSHPGDTDYEEEEEEEEEAEADRPECPYGTDCYRKNTLHRKEYKHTKKPAHRTRTVHKKTPAADEDEDDSFIDDDSEDVGDDSDYVPLDSDDSGKEDIKRLQKEAKAFLRKRR